MATTTRNPQAIADQLRDMGNRIIAGERTISRSDAAQLLTGLTIPQLTAIYTALGKTVYRRRRADIVEDLIEVSVGRRLDSMAISRNGGWS